MKVLVTGANGFVGKHLVRGLIKKKYKVRVLIREKDYFLPNVEVFIGNLFDKEVLKKAIKGVDVVYHLAAALGRHKVSDEEMYKTNVEGSLNLVGVLDKQKLIFMSSSGVFGPGINLNEKSNPYPRTCYEKTKLITEEKLKKIYNNLLIIRPTLIYGPEDMFFLKIIKTIKNKKYFLMGNGKNLINLVYIDNLVDFLIKVINKRGDYNVASDNINIKEFSELIANKLNVKLIRFKVPKFIAFVAANIIDMLKLKLPLTVSAYHFLTENRSFDNSKVLNEGFKQTPFELGIDKTIKWYKENNLL